MLDDVLILCFAQRCGRLQPPLYPALPPHGLALLGQVSFKVGAIRIALELVVKYGGCEDIEKILAVAQPEDVMYVESIYEYLGTQGDNSVTEKLQRLDEAMANSGF